VPYKTVRIPICVVLGWRSMLAVRLWPTDNVFKICRHMALNARTLVLNELFRIRRRSRSCVLYDSPVCQTVLWTVLLKAGDRFSSRTVNNESTA
jgi:hypothetical protein